MQMTSHYVTPLREQIRYLWCSLLIPDFCSLHRVLKFLFVNVLESLWMKALKYNFNEAVFILKTFPVWITLFHTLDIKYELHAFQNQPPPALRGLMLSLWWRAEREYSSSKNTFFINQNSRTLSRAQISQSNYLPKLKPNVREVITLKLEPSHPVHDTRSGPYRCIGCINLRTKAQTWADMVLLRLKEEKCSLAV